MGNAFVAELKNEAPRGRDVTNEDRNSEASQRGTQRDAEGSELSYTMTGCVLCVQVLLMTLMTLTGNYGFYPLLTLTLCLSLIDDTWLNSWTGSGLIYKGWHRLFRPLSLSSLFGLCNRTCGRSFDCSRLEAQCDNPVYRNKALQKVREELKSTILERNHSKHW